MKRFFGRKENDKIVIDGSELIHLRQVLRMREGQEIIVSVDDENDYYCTLAEVGKNKAVCDINKVERCVGEPKKNIVLYQAMPKREYFETIITKAVELGVSEIRPFISKFTVNHSFKRERVNQIIQTACKQCERSRLVEVYDVADFKSALKELSSFDVVIFAYENSNTPLKPDTLIGKNNVAVIVGAEGGFSEEEAQLIISASEKVKSISLGTRILRCDTASVAMLSIVDILSEN